MWLWILVTALGRPGAVTGWVRDTSGQPLPGVHVYVSMLHRGTTTDLDGSFTLSLSPGMYQLKISHIGYQDTVVPIQIQPQQILHLNLVLRPSVLYTQGIVVTAQRYAQSAELATVDSDIRTRTSLNLRMGSSLEALEDLNFVQVDVTTRSLANLVSIRGASDLRGGGLGNRVLLLWNGRPANLPGTGGAEWAAFPLDAIAREEVVFGTYSALYGTHAVGGVIHLLPLSPWEAPSFRFRGGVGDIRPVADWMITSPNLKPPNPWVEGSLLASYRRSTWGVVGLWNQEKEEGFAENRNVDVRRYYAAAVWRKGSFDIWLSQVGMKATNGKPFPWKDVAHPLEVPDGVEGMIQKKNQVNSDVMIRGRWRKLQWNLQGYRQDHVQEDWPAGSSSPNVTVSMQAYGMEGHAQGKSWGFRWMVGISWRRDSLHSEVLYGQHRQTIAGMYLQGTSQITARQLLTWGVRWDQSVVDGKRGFSWWTPRLGWVWIPKGDRWTLRFSVGQAFRAPTLAEMFLQRVLTDNLYFRQNPNLRPEVITSVEGGIVRHFHKGRVSLTFFSSHYKNLIDFFPVEDAVSLYEARNRNRARIQGVDLAVHMPVWGPFSFSGAYEWLDARDVETNEVLAYRPHHRLHLRFLFHTSRWNILLSSLARSKIERGVFSSETPYLPEAFQRWDLRGRFQVHPRLAIQGEVTNLFNIRYELFARYAMPGRSYRMMIDISL